LETCWYKRNEQALTRVWTILLKSMNDFFKNFTENTLEVDCIWTAFLFTYDSCHGIIAPFNCSILLTSLQFMGNSAMYHTHTTFNLFLLLYGFESWGNLIILLVWYKVNVAIFPINKTVIKLLSPGIYLCYASIPTVF